MRLLALGISPLMGGRSGPPQAAVLLSSAGQFPESIAAGAALGTLSVVNVTGTPTYTLTNSDGTRVALTGANVTRGATAWDYETHPLVTFVITVTGTTPAIAPRTFTLDVTNVLETILAALGLSPSTVPEGSVAGTIVGAITGKTSGSTLTLTDNAGGRFAISGTNLVTTSIPTDYETSTLHAITIRETHPDAAPRDTALAVTVSDVLGAPGEPPAITNDTTQDVADDAIVSLTLTATEAGTWAITGGADALMFEIAGSSVGAEALDYQLPEDANHDNVYEVQITFTSTATGLTDTDMFYFTVLPPSAWVPTDLGSALVAAYTALRAGTVHTASGNITSWDDFSGNSRTLTSAVGNEPAYSATGFSGGPGLTFDPTNNERMATALDAINLGTGTAFAIFFSIILRNTTESFGRILGFKQFGETDDIATPSFNIARQSGNDAFDFYSDSPICSFAATYATPLRLALVCSGTTARFYIDNVAQTSAAFTTTLGPVGTLRLAAFTDGQTNFGGDLRAIGIMNRNPTAGELTQWDTWLQNPV